MTARTPLALAVRSLVLCPLACAVYNDDSLGLNPGGDFPAEVGGSAGAAAKGGEGHGPASAGTSAKPQGGATSLAGAAGATQTGSGGKGGGGGGGGEQPVGGESASDGGEAAGGSSSGSSGGGKGGTAAIGGASGGQGGGASSSGGIGGTAGAAGSAGSGTAGGAAVPACSDHPLSARSAWLASASHSDSASSGVPANLLDGKITRWSTGKAQAGDEWLQIDFGATATINHVNLQQGDDTNDYPRSYAVIVSNTPKDTSGTVRVTGSGKSGVSTAILLPALASGRYLLIKQSSSSLSWWSAEEIEVSCTD